MSLYQRRLEAIMESNDCDASEAAAIMSDEFAHDELPIEDEVDRFFRENDDD